MRSTHANNAEAMTRKGMEMAARVSQLLTDSHNNMTVRIKSLKGFNDLDILLRKLRTTVDGAAESEETTRNPGFHNTLQ